MTREELREWWLVTDPAILCRMLDGRTAILIIGPTNSQVEAGIWRFGFQVPGEEDIRWREAASLERVGDALIEKRGSS